jgi:hypothetical protein
VFTISGTSAQIGADPIHLRHKKRKNAERIIIVPAIRRYQGRTDLRAGAFLPVRNELRYQQHFATLSTRLDT